MLESKGPLANIKFGVELLDLTFASRSRGKYRANIKSAPLPPRPNFLKAPETHLLEGPGNIGTLVLARLDTTRLYKIIGVLVPLAVRKVVPKYGRRGLRLTDDANPHIGLGQPRQRFLDMPRGLVAGDHGLEAVDGGGVVVLFHIVAADVHFLAGELIARAFEL